MQTWDHRLEQPVQSLSSSTTSSLGESTTVSTEQKVKPVINGGSVPTMPTARSGSYGPYTVVDADTGRPIRISRFGRASKAFYAGDIWLLDHPDRDYRVLDWKLRTVARPHG